MHDSLKNILYESIKAKYPSYLTTAEVEQICKDHNKKISNGERRLRKSESPRVLAVRNAKRAIIGYKWIPQKAEIITQPMKRETDLEALNDQLQTILDSMNPKDYWNSMETIDQIKRAIKSDEEWKKQAVIKQFSVPS